MSMFKPEKIEIVYNAILDYLNDNKPFDLERVLPYLNSRFAKSSININKTGLKEILAMLLEKKSVVEGSLLRKEELLNYETRKRVFNIIKDNPGVLFNDISKELEINSSVIYWHLKILLKFGCIKKTMVGKRQIFYCLNTKEKEAIRSYYMSRKNSKKIIEYLRTNDFGVTKTKLATNLKIHNYTLTKYLDKLELLKVIFKDAKSKNNLYFLSEEFF